jgi:hypothetical protein
MYSLRLAVLGPGIAGILGVLGFAQLQLIRSITSDLPAVLLISMVTLFLLE